MELRVRSGAAPILVIAKLTLFFSVPALVATGIARVPLRKWLPADALAECLWTGTLILFGYYFAEFIGGAQNWMRSVALIGGPLLFITGIFLLKRAGYRWGEARGSITPSA